MVLTILAVGCAGPEVQHSDVLHDICRNSRLFDLYGKETLSFTFNARLPDKTVRRSWEWHIPDNRIFLNGEAHGPSAKFVNDVYWLLFPLKAYEDREKTQVTVTRDRTSPLSGEALTEVEIRYVDGKGYTPNDTYRLYVDGRSMIREWSYLKSGREPPARTTRWEAYETIGGLTLSLVREGSGGFQVWFTDVRVE
jgi:hypothetical protein